MDGDGGSGDVVVGGCGGVAARVRRMEVEVRVEGGRCRRGGWR